MSVRYIASISVLVCGFLMTVVGLASIFSKNPHAELATAGITAILSSGLVATVGKGNDS
jgi:hypothetical protein